MYYKKIKARGYLIEYIQTFTGYHFLYINHEKVPKKFSMKKMKFLFIDDNAKIEVIATTVPPWYIKRELDIYFDDVLVASNISPVLKFNTKKLIKESKHKKLALDFLKVFDIDDALHHLQQAKSENPEDVDIDFHLACCYSLMERKKEGLYHLSKFESYFKDAKYRMSREDKLAWLRIERLKK